MRKKWLYISSLIVLVVYFKGTLGLISADETEQNFFLKFTALNIFATTLITLTHHQKWTKTFILSCISIILFGYFIEVAGVKTGVIFGNYFYGKSLGFKLLEVPFIIGINWLLLTYIISGVLHRINNIYLFSLSAAAIMTTLDVLIEPVAVKLDFWQWNNGIIPFQNYVAWFIISAFLFYSLRKFNGKIISPISYVILPLQFIFFLALNILLH